MKDTSRKDHESQKPGDKNNRIPGQENLPDRSNEAPNPDVDQMPERSKNNSGEKPG